MDDQIVKALAFNGTVRIYAAVTTEVVALAQRKHDTWPTASAALGRTLTGALLLGSTLKGEDQVTVKIEGGGPIGAIVAHADTKGYTRGYVSHPHVDAPLNSHGKLDVAGVVGDQGFLSVTKDLGLKDHFTGQVPLRTGEIGDDFTYYFASSEQIPSSVGLGVIVQPDESIKASGGLMLQMLPGADDEVIDKLEQHINQSVPISQMVDQGYTPEAMIEAWLGTQDFQVLEQMAPAFRCQCSKERFARSLASLGKEEIDEMIREDGGAEATCHFCNTTYWFDEDELRDIRQKAL